MNKLQEKIKEQGRTQKWLANKIGISETTFSKYVKGKLKPKYFICEEIAKILDCRPDDIFFGN